MRIWNCNFILMRKRFQKYKRGSRRAFAAELESHLPLYAKRQVTARRMQLVMRSYALGFAVRFSAQV